jgi:hypothetical protein
LLPEEIVDVNIIRFIQTSNLSYEEYLQQLQELFELSEEVAEELLNIYGIREFIRSESISLPTMSSQLNDFGPMLTHYISYLESNTPRDTWHRRKKDLLTSLGKINGFVSGKDSVHGLVIGDVQSGKTSNFLGLIAHAIDVYIPLIIVISGSTNVLRNQTQNRLDEAFGVFKDSRFINLTNSDEPRIHRPLSGGTEIRWYTGDFTHPGFDLSECIAPVVLIIKKTPNVLRRTRDWLREWRNDGVLEKSILVIDDESDAASINTLYVDPEGPEIPDNIADLNRRATTINRLIREILLTTSKSKYIGYTATPYAALLSDPHDYSTELGESLYPRDFIIALPTPAPHSGLSEYFSRNGHLRRNISIISEQDSQIITQRLPSELPNTLINAIYDFVITGAMKLEHNAFDYQFHHTMLIHVHMETCNHERLAQYVRNFGVRLSENFCRRNFLGQRTREYEHMKSRWESEFSVTNEQEDLLDDAVTQFFSKFDFDTDVCTINSYEGDEEPLFETSSRLEYSEEGTWVIAIGGQILSRGLTVEGLVISYFARHSAMYDSLAQMARWCGYHSNFVKQLIRVNTTETILRWFQFIYDVDTRIREDVAILEQTIGATPIDLAPRILQYQREEEIFLPTRRGALRHAHLRNMSYSGTTPSTLHLCLHDSQLLTENDDLLNSLLEQIDSEAWQDLVLGGGKKTPISYELVEDFLLGFNQNQEHGLEINDILNYINLCRQDGQLNTWTLALFSPQYGETTNITTLDQNPDFPLNKTRRGKMPIGRLDVLFDKRHLFADLDDELVGETRAHSRRLSRELRPVRKGLLGIYILDGEYEPEPNGSRGFVRLHVNSNETRDVVAFGIALPESEIILGENFYIAPGVEPIRD